MHIRQGKVTKYHILAILMSAVVCFGYYPFLFALIGGLTIWIMLVTKGSIQTTKITLCWLAIALLWLIGSCYSVSPDRGIKYTITLICLIIMASYVKRYTILHELIAIVMYAMSMCHVFFTLLRQVYAPVVELVCSIILLPGMVQRQEAFVAGGMWNGNLGITTQTGWNGLYCAIAVGMAYVFWRKKHQYIHLIAMFAALAALMLTNKRGHLVGMIAGLMVVLFVNRTRKLRLGTLLRVAFACLVAVVCIRMALQYIPNVTSMFDKIVSLSGSSLGDMSSGRLDIYARMLDTMTPLQWVVGYGTGSTDTIMGIDGHNIYLQILFESGIIGFVLFIYTFVYAYWKTYQKAKQEKTWMLNISLYIQTLFLVYGMLGNPLYDTPMLFMYLLWVFIASGQWGRKTESVNLSLERVTRDEGLSADRKGHSVCTEAHR